MFYCNELQKTLQAKVVGLIILIFASFSNLKNEIHQEK